MQFTSPKLPSMKIQEKEVGVSKHLPYSYLEEHDIVRTKSGDYLTVLKVEGISWDTLEDAELNFEQTLRGKLFGALGDPRFALYHTIIRSKVTVNLAADSDVPMVQQLEIAYQKTLLADPLFANDLYLVILLKGSGSKGNRVVSRINQWFTGISHNLVRKQAQEMREEAIKELNEVTLRFITTLSQYRVRKLGLIRTDRGIFSEQLSFLSRILNWDDAPLLAVESDISNYLPKRQLFFGHRGIQSVGNLEGDSKFASMVSLKEYPASTWPGMLDDLVKLPVEMVITQSFVFQHRQESRENLELQLRRLHQSRDPDQKGIIQLQEALGGVVSGEFGFGYHHLTVMVLADSLEELEHSVASVNKYLSECGIIAVRERLNTEAAFWAQFPGNFRYIVRKMPITSQNFSSLCSLNNDPIGQKSGNHWGDAVTLLKTPANLPYYFNFHKRRSDVGHSLILGMTGSGKTLLTCFLMAMALKSNARLFYFDKDHGAEAFMRGLGADHCTLGGKTMQMGLNPLQLPDTRRNRRFLSTWLASLLTAFGDVLSSEDMDVIHEAVRLNYEKLGTQERTLENLAEAFGRGGPGTLRNRLDQWHSGKQFSEFFGASQDTLRLDGRFFCFEMEHLLEKANETALPSVLLYLFHRIQLVLSENAGMPTIICLDEAWALLDNPIFSNNIKNWLKTFRKRNAIVVLLSQEVTDISKSAISSTLNSETVTKIFFPNPAPQKEVYQDIFRLTDREMSLLKDYSVDKRYFLVKQPHESTFARLDLTGMEEWIPLLSGNSSTLPLLHQLILEQGEDPEKWLPIYLEKAAELRQKRV